MIITDKNIDGGKAFAWGRVRHSSLCSDGGIKKEKLMCVCITMKNSDL